MALDLIMVALALAAISGLPGLALGRGSSKSQWLAVGFMSLGALAGLLGAGLGLFTPPRVLLVFPWPAMGDSVIGLDALSAFFLLPIFLMGGLGSIYSLGYWPQSRFPRSGRKLQLFWGLLVAGLGLLVISRHAMAFLLGWEVMALAAFFLVSLEDQREESRSAGLIYMIATHVGLIALFAMFVLWRWATGSYILQPSHGMSFGVLNALFFLALFGFGLKAGMMPLHFWLPGAHAQAPSHVSAMLSGVVLKMGIYGLLRMLSLLPMLPVAWGALILLLGAASGILGVVFAIGQHDLKRLLAYHSVENIGIILMGLGLALLGRSSQRPEWVVLGMAGCLLHVWNHSLFKSLLFLGAGSVVHAAKTRQIDHLGGLAKAMPWTAALFLAGAVAICGLPPLNGFVSEWLVYLGLLQTMTVPGGYSAAMLAAPVLAMIGALAVACFVKVCGAVFLGLPRTPAADHARESSRFMLGPMLVLAVVCAAIGMAPGLVAPVLDQAIAGWSLVPVSTAQNLSRIAPLQTLSYLIWLLLAGMVVFGAVVALAGKIRRPRPVNTWDCGYASPGSRMQYTASAFAQMLVAMFGWLLRPRGRQVNLAGVFPPPAKLHTHVEDPVLDRWLLPVSHVLGRRLGWFHRFQQGLTQHYVFYILLTVVVMLSTLLPVKELFAWLLAR